MISKEDIIAQREHALQSTDFSELGEKYPGKVRDVYTKDNQMVIVTSDRISAFDVVLGTIPFKGQILNQMAVFWFDKTKDLVANHLIAHPDPNVLIVKKCKPFPVEFIVRKYITGSLWRDFEKGGRNMYGLEFSENLKKDQRFPEPIFTPSTKEVGGKHDMPISKKEIVEQGLMTQEHLDQAEQISLALFKRGTEIAAQQGLILVDTKYEMGLDDEGNIVLVDEIHTSDSSRYWFTDSYEELFAQGKPQKMLDKEYLRQWLISQGYMGDGPIPEFPDDVLAAGVQKYIEAYQLITGQEFEPHAGDIKKRIKTNLINAGYING